MANAAKERRKAIKELERLGCTVDQTAAGHKWGRVTAPNGAVTSIWSTPRSPENHARDLVRWAERNQE